jgi:hypothetical protein
MSLRVVLSLNTRVCVLVLRQRLRQRVVCDRKRRGSEFLDCESRGGGRRSSPLATIRQLVEYQEAVHGKGCRRGTTGTVLLLSIDHRPQAIK